MSKSIQAHLKQSSILNVPFQKYEKDFTFVVNGEEFKTNRFISDLLSPVLCRIHSVDPTVDKFTINTQRTGDFSLLLKLTSFEPSDIFEKEIPFLSEVIEKLGNGTIEFENEYKKENDANNTNDTNDMTVDNVLTHLQEHEKYFNIYYNQISREIEFVASHLYEILEKHEEYRVNLSLSTLMRITVNDKIRLKSEDQLIKFVNDLYSSNSKYSVLYENVLFSNVSKEKMKEFVSIFDVNDMSTEVWKCMSNRLCCDIQNNNQNPGIESRYFEEEKIAKRQSNKCVPFRGI